MFFDTKDGSEIKAIVIEDPSTFILPDNPIKADYTFIDWYYDEQYSQIFQLEDILLGTINQDTTLYAKWNYNYVTITFETNGGENLESLIVEHGN